MNFALTAVGICFKSHLLARMALLLAPPLLENFVVNNWVVNMAKADLGIKRTCLSCGMRFYDFKKTPIICPGCQSEFYPEALVRSKRSRASTKDTAKRASEEAAVEIAEDGVDADDASLEDDGNDAGGVKSEDGDDVEYDDNDISVDDEDDAGLISDDLDEDDDILPGIGKDDD